MNEAEQRTDAITIDEATAQFLKVIETLDEENFEKMAEIMISDGATLESFQEFRDEYGLQDDPDAEILEKELERQLAS